MIIVLNNTLIYNYICKLKFIKLNQLHNLFLLMFLLILFISFSNVYNLSLVVYFNILIFVEYSSISFLVGLFYYYFCSLALNLLFHIHLFTSLSFISFYFIFYITFWNYVNIFSFYNSIFYICRFSSCN